MRSGTTAHTGAPDPTSVRARRSGCAASGRAARRDWRSRIETAPTRSALLSRPPSRRACPPRESLRSTSRGNAATLSEIACMTDGVMDACSWRACIRASRICCRRGSSSTKSWLNPSGLRDGRIGLAPLAAVLSFLRQEGEPYRPRSPGARASTRPSGRVVDLLRVSRARCIRRAPPTVARASRAARRTQDGARDVARQPRDRPLAQRARRPSTSAARSSARCAIGPSSRSASFTPRPSGASWHCSIWTSTWPPSSAARRAQDSASCRSACAPGLKFKMQNARCKRRQTAGTCGHAAADAATPHGHVSVLAWSWPLFAFCILPFAFHRSRPRHRRRRRAAAGHAVREQHARAASRLAGRGVGRRC